MSMQRHLRWFILALLLALPIWGGIQSARAESVPWASLTASAGQPSPYPVWAGGTCTVSLKSTLKPVGSAVENLMATSQSWYITSVSYSANDASWTTKWTGNSATASVSDFFDISVSGGVGGATISATLGENRQAGYYQIAFSTTANVEADVSGQQQHGTVSAAGSTPPAAVKVSITYTGSVAGANGDTTDSGTVVTSKTTDVHAGWPIQLGAVITPAAFANNYKQFTWTISGAGGNGSAAINGYVVSATTGVAVPNEDATSAYQTAVVAKLVPSADTKATFPDPSSPGILKKYYYTESGSYTASVTPSGAGANAKTTFNVAAPTTTLTAKYQYPTRLFVYGTGPADFIYLRQTSALGAQNLTSESQAGITFTHPPVHKTVSGANTFMGNSYFVQVYSQADLWYPIGGGNPYSAFGTGLDGSDPYQANIVDSNGNDFVADAPTRLTDRHAGQINYSPVIIDDNPTMWVMYTPAAAGSIDVPLASSAWHWGAVAKWNAQTKSWDESGIAPAAAGPAPASLTHTYPVWSVVLEPPNPPL